MCSGSNCPKSIYTSPWLWKCCHSVQLLWVWILAPYSQGCLSVVASASCRRIWQCLRTSVTESGISSSGVVRGLRLSCSSPVQYQCSSANGSLQHSDSSERRWCLAAASASSRGQVKGNIPALLAFITQSI